MVHLVETATEFDDDGRVAVRDSLCKYLGWHNSYNLDGDRKSRAAAERLLPMFDRLAPTDPVKASLWLFASDWITLPGGRERDHERHRESLARERGRALGFVFASLGWSGVSRLVAEAAAPGLVGWEIGRSALDPTEIVGWLLERQRTAGWARVDPVLRGLLTGMTDERRAATLDLALAQLRAQGRTSAIPDLLISAPFAPDSWKLLEPKDDAIQDRYWATVVPGFCRLDREDIGTAVEQLTNQGRARSAFQLLMYEPERVDSLVLKRVLEAIRSGVEPDGPLPDGWHIGDAISAIEAAGKVPRRDLAMLEFAFFRALEPTEHGAKNLYAELLADPALFMECVRLAYKPRNSEPDPVSESLKAAADLAWHILHSGRGIPGTMPDGSVDGVELKRWVVEVRRLAAESDRDAVVDFTVGEWLSDCKPDCDSIWPPPVIAELLDEDQHVDTRRGFYTGAINNRGVTSRAMGEGGAQERALAAQFRERAAAVANRFPRVAEVLYSIATNYEQDARREDDEANLRSDGL